jgi:hypothetical protein
MSKITCPNCGVATSFSPALISGKGVLVDDSNKIYTKWGEVRISAITPYVYEEETYAILVCQSCREYFVAKREKYSQESSENWIAVYPIQHKVAAEGIQPPIKGEFEEASLCFVVGAYRACLLVCRTALIAMQREQGVSNLKELMGKGAISNILYKQADQVRLWGNMVGHEDIPEAITKEDCEQLLTYLETLLDAVYVQPIRLSTLTQKLGKLKKKDDAQKD